MERREALKAISGIGAVTVTGGVGFLASAGSAAAQVGSFSINGASIETDDGTVNDVTITASGEGEYDGIDERVTAIKFILRTSTPDGWEDLASARYTVSETGSLHSHAGNQDVDFGTVSVLNNSSWTASDFASNTDGESAETTVPYELKLEIFASGDVVASANIKDEATYKVTNEASSTSTGGSGSAGLSGEDQDPA